MARPPEDHSRILHESLGRRARGSRRARRRSALKRARRSTRLSLCRVVRPSRGSVLVLAAAALVVAGVVFRCWLAFGHVGVADSDEAIVGLMAVRLLRHGELPAFYWGQAYGGSLEAVLVAPSVALLGTTTFALRLPTVLLGLGASWLTWRIARHRFSRLVAASAGLMSLFFPAALVWFGTKERGFYTLTAALGLLAVLCGLNIDEQPRRLTFWAGLGATVGVGWWMSPNIVYYAGPVAVWLIVRGLWRQVRGVAIATGTLLLGSSVWIVANSRSGLASLRVPDWGHSSTYWTRLGFFWTGALPFTLGLRRPSGGQWIVSPLFGIGTYLVVLVSLVAVICFGKRHPSWTSHPELFLFATAPFLFAIFPANWTLGDGDGRYTYFIASVIPLVLCYLMMTKRGRVGVAALVLVTTVSFMSDTTRLRRLTPPSTTPIAYALEAEGVHTVLGDYWTAYQLTFATDENVIASPARGFRRYRPYVETVMRSSPAYVYLRRGPLDQDASLLERLRAHHVHYRRITRGAYYAIVPASSGTRAP